MVIARSVETFYGLPVRPFEPEGGPSAKFAPRIHVGWNEEVDAVAQIEALAAHDGASSTRALLIGDWGEAATGTSSDDVIAALVKASASMPSLEALFLGEMTYEECEISWIQHGDLTPLFGIESLRELWVRGGAMGLAPVRHERLRKLVFESGGLASAVPLALAASDLPALEHLELWLGTDEYGGVDDIEAVAPVLASDGFPALRHLGLRNSVIADEVAARLCGSPLMRRISTLDLSLGTLGDEGARALAACEHLARLTSIDVHHHYISDGVLAALRACGPEIIATGAEEPDDDDDEGYRYVAHSE